MKERKTKNFDNYYCVEMLNFGNNLELKKNI